MDKVHLRALGIIGDSLTLVGSIVLALDGLLKGRMLRQDRATIYTSDSLTNIGFRLDDSKQKTITKERVEEAGAIRSQWLAWTGVALLVAGFSVLLATRILGA